MKILNVNAVKIWLFNPTISHPCFLPEWSAASCHASIPKLLKSGPGVLDEPFYKRNHNICKILQTRGPLFKEPKWWAAGGSE